MYEMPIFRSNQNEIKRILRISVICTTPMSAISPTLLRLRDDVEYELESKHAAA